MADPPTKRPVLTSVGSLPPLATSPDEALRNAVALQRAHGLELLTDGEQRGDMLSLYESLPGIEIQGGVPRIVGRVQPPEDPSAFVKIHDLDLLRGRHPDLRFKVSLTGPTTFVLACATGGSGPAYRGALDPALHDDLTEAIRTIAREVGRRDAELQVDDPILSQGMRDYGPALRRIDAIASEVPRERASLHVCGGLGRFKTLEALFRLEEVSALNLAFAGSAERENLALLDRRPWDDHDLGLGAGCAPVQVIRREDVLGPEGVAALLESIGQRIGVDRLRYVLPDCGLRATPLSLVAPILSGLRGGYESVFPREG